MDFNNAYGDKILNLGGGAGGIQKEQNGRVDLLSQENTKTKIEMMEKINIKNKATSYCDALQGQWEETSLSQSFFSKENIQIIQNAIRANVYEQSNKQFIIPPPNVDNLKIILRSTFLSFAEFYNENITKQIEYLNDIVIKYCSKELYSASTSYVKYLKDQSTMYEPHKRELQHDRQYKELQLKDWV
jgi:hypothetical protein